MSMDEFLANILNSDESQVISESIQDEASAAREKSPASSTEPSSNPQQASFSVPPTVCNKTADEVWSEIHKGQPQQNESNSNNLTQSGILRKQPTLEIMSLEDFLVKAGVVQKSALPLSPPSPPTLFPNQTNFIRPLQPSYGFRAAAMGLGFSTQQNVGNCVATMAYPSHQMFPQNNSLTVNGPKTGWVTADRCQNMREPSGLNTTRRIIDGSPEVPVDRRQRRMLKNRESAARSRARKQAYTVELEAELTRLKLENDMLKQVLVEAKRNSKQEIALKKSPTKAKRGAKMLSAIRRTLSALW